MNRLLTASRQLLVAAPRRINPASLAVMQTRQLHISAQRQGCTPGMPVMFMIDYDRKNWDPEMEVEYELMPRDEYGVPAVIPPEVSTMIRHTYYVPPQFYPWLKKLGDDTPELKPYLDKLINGEMTFTDYEEMFYKFAKPLKVHRPRIPLAYRTEAEIKKEAEVNWESAWLSFRQRVMNDYQTQHHLRDFIAGMAIGLYMAWLYIQKHKQYRIDMKLFYLEAPEHKINWVVPRGDL